MASGHIVVTSSDERTIAALRTAKDAVTEIAPRKPRVKLKGIPHEYETNFV